MFYSQLVIVPSTEKILLKKLSIVRRIVCINITTLEWLGSKYVHETTLEYEVFLCWVVTTSQIQKRWNNAKVTQLEFSKQEHVWES